MSLFIEETVSNIKIIIMLKVYNVLFVEFVRTLTAKKIEIDYSKVTQSLLPEFLHVNRYSIPSMESFYKDIFIPKIPAIITGDY